MWRKLQFLILPSQDIIQAYPLHRKCFEANSEEEWFFWLQHNQQSNSEAQKQVCNKTTNTGFLWSELTTQLDHEFLLVNYLNFMHLPINQRSAPYFPWANAYHVQNKYWFLLGLKVLTVSIILLSSPVEQTVNKAEDKWPQYTENLILTNILKLKAQHATKKMENQKGENIVISLKSIIS